MIVLMAALFITMLINVPIAFSIGISALIYIFFTEAAPLTLIAQRMVVGVDSFPLLAIPLFLIAGSLMAEADMTPRIMRFASSLVGRIPGGLAIVMVISCMLFGAISGSGVADVVAIGSLLLPIMKRSGYDSGFSASLLGCSGALGTIIPPSIVMVILGVTTGISIGKLFLGGIIPGIITGASLMILSYIFAVKKGYETGEKFSLKNVLLSFKDALLALLTPLIIIGGIISGVFTPTEAAVAAVAYALFLGIFVYRNLEISRLPGLILSTVETSASILLIIASASLFGWVLAAEQIPQRFADIFLSLTNNYYMILLLINLMLLFLGIFMETIAIIIIMVPVLMPIIKLLGMDPVHFGVMLAVNLAIGANTPPVGVDLLAACRIGEIALEDASRYVIFFVGAMIMALIVIVLFPPLVVFIPNHFMTK
ncbi:MAG: TRAP transporter large permease [Deltaproteobacteria bacterium]|nr:TRAP transporter large permease [Deltaproteobacteria bacterium]